MIFFFYLVWVCPFFLIGAAVLDNGSLFCYLFISVIKVGVLKSWIGNG